MGFRPALATTLAQKGRTGPLCAEAVRCILPRGTSGQIAPYRRLASLPPPDVNVDKSDWEEFLDEWGNINRSR